MTVSSNIFDLSKEDLQSLLDSWGEPNFRATQVWLGLYQNLYDSPDQFTALSKTLREKLAGQFSNFEGEGRQVFTNIKPIKELESTDSRTHKTLSSCLMVMS